MISQRAIDAIEYSDTDELLRVIDGHCEAKDWELLIELRARCNEAVGRGKQVWGVEEHIRYRLALEAPYQYAGPVVSEGRARFALGPLPEVAASTKTFAEMDSHLTPGPPRDTFAAERVTRGEEVGIEIPDLPPVLMPWEPSYQVATYKANKVDTPAPPLPDLEDVSLPGDSEALDDPHSVGALGDLVEAWTDQSNGRCQTASVQGTHLDAIKAMGLPRARVGPLELSEALAWMGWAGASGGAHGKRRGAAAGRYAAWWTLATLADLEWPPEPKQVKAAGERLRWHWFDDGSPETGWVLRLAIHDPRDDLAWAVAAVDIAD